MTQVGTLCFILMVAGPVPGSEQLLREAVASFEREDYESAADAFEELNRRGARNPQHYLNQGNAELLAGRLPQAILSYHRGLRLEPGNRELHANLRYARDQVGYDKTLRPADAHWLPLRPAALFWSACAFWSLAFVALTFWLFTARLTYFAAMAAFFALAVVCATGFGWWQWQASYEAAVPLVVIAENHTPFYQGNGPGYPVHAQTPTLARGMEARQLHRRGDWLQIQLPSGDVGWIQRSAVSRLLNADR